MRRFHSSRSRTSLTESSPIANEGSLDWSGDAPPPRRACRSRTDSAQRAARDRPAYDRPQLPADENAPRHRRRLGEALLTVLPTEVVNATDRGSPSERAVGSGAVVVVEPVWQRAVAVSI